MRVLLNLLVLGSLLLALAGCASSPRSGYGAETEDAIAGDAAVPDPNKPRLFFSGGDVQQVRGAALGAAVTQGWKVQETSGDNSLILMHNLDSSAAEALAPGSSRGPLPPIVEVRADFFPRPGGVETQLGAQVITQRGTPKEMRQDYTDAYRNELSHSLAMLQTAWHEAGPRIANALPPTGGFQDSTPTEGQVAATSAPTPLGSGFTGQDEAEPEANPPVPVASPPVAAAQAEADEATDFSTAATWALPAGAAVTAAAAAQARASALPPAPTSARIGPAPVVSRAPSPNPRLIQSPATLARTASASPQTVTAKASGTPSTAKGGQSAVTSPSTGKAGNASATTPVKATATATKTKMTAGSAATSKPAAKTDPKANTSPTVSKKTPGAAAKTTATATKPAVKTKTPAPSTAPKTPKPTGAPAPAPAGSTSKASGKTTTANQQPAKPATASAKAASAAGTTASGTASSKTTTNAPKANSSSKTTAATTGAKKTTPSKEN